MRIAGEWLFCLVGRIGNALLTLALTGLNLLGWPMKWLWCTFLREGDLEKLPMRDLKLEVIIVDESEKNQNPCTNEEVDDRIQHANRILRETARIAVQRESAISRIQSGHLFRIESSGVRGKVTEYMKGVFFLLGRSDWRHLTVYVVGSVSGAGGLHLPVYGSVFIEPGGADTTLCHEIGHALLGLGNTYHSAKAGHLMATPPSKREGACDWPRGVPILSRNERCTMRRSRWLDWSWVPVLP